MRSKKQSKYLLKAPAAPLYHPLSQVEGKRKYGAEKPSLIMVNAFNGKVPMVSVRTLCKEQGRTVMEGGKGQFLVWFF